MKPFFIRAALSAAFVLAVLATVPAAAASAEAGAARPRNIARTVFEQSAAAPTKPLCQDSMKPPNTVTCLTQYYGGKVISNVKVYAVAWTSNLDPTTSAGIPHFLDALTNSEVMDWLSEYNTDINIQAGTSLGGAGTQQLIGRGVYAGSYTITPSNANSGKNLTDAQLTAELSAQILAHQLPFPDGNTIYMTYFPPGYVITLSDGSASCKAFCAYHGAVAPSAGLPEFYYGVYPDFGSGGCEVGCGPQKNTPFQNLCSASTHELIEAITDAEVSLAAGTDKPLAWYDNNAGEVGDMCNQHVDTIVGLDGNTYTVQQNYSQRTGQCQTTRTDKQDFKVQLNPNRVAIAAGATMTVPLTAATTAGAAQTLTLTLTAPDGLPTGVTAAFDSPTIQSDGTAQLTFTVAQGAAIVHDAVLVVQARGGTSNSTHTAAVLVAVVAPPSVTLQGPSNGATVSGTVSLSASGTPGAGGTLAGVTLSIGSKKVASGAAAATFSWDTTTAPNGSTTLTATATDTDGGTASSSVTVTVTNDFTITLSPATATAAIGGSPATLMIATTAIGSAESITLAASGLPAGVTAAFSPASVAAGANSTLTLTAPANTAAVPLATITVTGTTPSVAAGHAATAQLTVSAPSGCSSTGSSSFLLALAPAFLLLLRRRRVN